MLKKKITKILIGTNNIGKLREIKELLPKNLEIYSPKNFKIKSPPENGKTFEENSIIKAKFFSKKSKMACLSDDSGLEIDILNGDPGIYSARWGGRQGDFKKAMNRVFKELDKQNKSWRQKKIKARFVCALTIYQPNRMMINSIGKVEGHISPSMKGKNGFGYDSIFIPSGKKITFGEMKVSQKCKIDHRFKAFKKIKKFF
jgi:XTP/dITP diphosphohydrolase|tara:strand:+ start:18 stop:620 length:603 start_codon:yes stop_codon:yes gene_type:complete